MRQYAADIIVLCDACAESPDKKLWLARTKRAHIPEKLNFPPEQICSTCGKTSYKEQMDRYKIRPPTEAE